MPTTSTNLVTTVKFACDASEAGAEPFAFAELADRSGPLNMKGVRVEIQDMRPLLDTKDSPNIDVEGFEVMRNRYDALDQGTEDVWTVKYEREMEELLRRHLQARRVVSFAGAAIRRRDRKLDNAPVDTENLQPSAGAHVDGNDQTGRDKCVEVLGLNQESAEKERYAVINLWRPLKGPILDTPLAVCDTRTANLRDTIDTIDFYGPGTYVRYSDRQTWFYLRDMMPEEVLIFRCSDSMRREFNLTSSKGA